LPARKNQGIIKPIKKTIKSQAVGLTLKIMQDVVGLNKNQQSHMISLLTTEMKDTRKQAIKNALTRRNKNV